MQATIDPKDVIRFDRSTFELESKLVFDICVAGKNADQIAVKHAALLHVFGRLCDEIGARPETIFEAIRIIGQVGLIWSLTQVSMGQYGRIGGALWQLASEGIDLKTCGVAELESVKGIGPKTSRFFLLATRQGARYACLDTHLLRYLREELGIAAPKSTPSAGAKYDILEQQWLAHCDHLNVNPAEYDLKIWTKYSGRDGAAEKTNGSLHFHRRRQNYNPSH